MSVERWHKKNNVPMWPWRKKGDETQLTCLRVFFFLVRVCCLGKWSQIKNIDFFRNWYCICPLLVFSYYPCFRFDLAKSNQHLIRRAQIVLSRIQYRAVRCDVFFPHLCWRDVKRNLCEIINWQCPSFKCERLCTLAFYRFFFLYHHFKHSTV